MEGTEPVADEPLDDVAPAAEPPQPTPPPTDQAYTDALTLEKQGDLVGAYRALERVKAADPQHADIDDDLTRVRQSLIASLEDQAYDQELAGDVSKAIATWQQLLEIDPRNIPAQLSLKRLNQ
jgi:tetratricopeptide (TPR) repeat protein